MFSGCTVLLDSKNDGVVFCVPTVIYGSVDIPVVPGHHLLQQMNFQ